MLNKVDYSTKHCGSVNILYLHSVLCCCCTKHMLDVITRKHKNEWEIRHTSLYTEYREIWLTNECTEERDFNFLRKWCEYPYHNEKDVQKKSGYSFHHAMQVMLFYCLLELSEQVQFLAVYISHPRIYMLNYIQGYFDILKQRRMYLQ